MALPRGPWPCGLGRSAERREGVVVVGWENTSWVCDGGFAVRLESVNRADLYALVAA